MMGIQMAAVSVLLILFAVSVYSAAWKETDIAAGNFLHIYATQIENRIQKVDTQLTTIINEDADLQLLESEDEAKRHYASVRLAQSISDIIKIDQSADIFVITEADHDICIDAKADNLLYSDKNSLRKMFMDYVELGQQTDGWKFQKVGENFYLYRAIVRNRRVTAAAISVDSLLTTVSLKDVDTYGFVLADAKDMVKGYAGSLLFDKGTDISVDALRAGHNLENREDLLDGRVRLYSYGNLTNVFRHLYKNALFILAVIALLCIFDLYFMGTERKQIIQPMKGMIGDMERIRGGDYELRVEERGDSREFSLLSRT